MVLLGVLGREWRVVIYRGIMTTYGRSVFGGFFFAFKGYPCGIICMVIYGYSRNERGSRHVLHMGFCRKDKEMYSGTRVFRVTVTFGSPATLAQRGVLAS